MMILLSASAGFGVFFSPFSIFPYMSVFISILSGILSETFSSLTTMCTPVLTSHHSLAFFGIVFINLHLSSEKDSGWD